MKTFRKQDFPVSEIRRFLEPETMTAAQTKTTQKEHTMTTTTQTTATQRRSEQAAYKNAIRPFHVDVPEGELTELRRRINATKWPERETVTDASQGVQLATIQNLARYGRQITIGGRSRRN